MKKLICAAVVLSLVAVSRADMAVTPWASLYKGIDHSVGTNYGSTTVTNNGVVFTDSTLQSVHCVRVDLTDPDIQLFTTPRASNYVAESRETASLSISNFLKIYGVQVAADCNFYNPSDSGSEGSSTEVHGMFVSRGDLVSAVDGQNRYASILFTTNNVATINLTNRPTSPADLTGIYTVITGFYPLLTNGVNVWALYYTDFVNAYPDFQIHGVQPRTAYGLSQDRRYLYMMTIDGRQGLYSNGALDAETAMWLLQFGAWDAINMDGGGSTAMYMADSCGNPVAVNHSSYPQTVNPRHERYIGAHFGVYSVPSFISKIAATPGPTNATITWTTRVPGSSQVEYGLTQSYGSFSTNDSTMVTNHTITLTGLMPATRYYYRVLSSDGVTQYSSECGAPFTTTIDTSQFTSGVLLSLTSDWKYNTANLDGITWQAGGYDDSGWSHGPGVLWEDAVNPGGNAAIRFLPLQTELGLAPGSPSYPYTTYYFRTHFNYTNALNGATLTFSNYIDDGAVYYLNGAELYRAFVPAGATNGTAASGNFCSTGNATCPSVNTFSGSSLSLLQSGDNVLAVELHNIRGGGGIGTPSPDVTFGVTLLFSAPVTRTQPFITNVVATAGETTATITWTTISNSTSRVMYGLNGNLNQSTALDSTLVTKHSVTLTGLLQSTNYSFRVVSTVSGSQYTADGVFSTTLFFVNLVPMTGTWSYNTNNLDGLNWAGPEFDESLFLGQGQGLLYIKTNSDVSPLNTLLPATSTGLAYPTYYFRTHFAFDTNLAGLSLVFTNYIDDGAIFYLNGAEIQRVRMPASPQPVMYADAVGGCPPVNCHAVSNAPDIFRISGDLMTNMLRGIDNVLSAEVHQHSYTSPDLVFGSAVGLVRALVSETKLRIGRSGTITTISWDGTGFTLQKANGFGGTNQWSDLPGPVKTSPYSVTNPPVTTFYRLRN